MNKNDIADHLSSAIKDGDVKVFLPVLEEAVRAFGISNLCDATGYSRPNIQRATRPEANPRLETVNNIARGMNLAIRFVPTKNG